MEEADSRGEVLDINGLEVMEWLVGRSKEMMLNEMRGDRKSSVMETSEAESVGSLW